MTFQDWVERSKQRYEQEPFHKATLGSANAFAMGIKRRIGWHLGKPIWERDDWDVLVIMDACRTDLMREVQPEYETLPAETGAIFSNASCSIDWIIKNFAECPEAASTAGYITGNPFAEHTADDARSADLSADALGYYAPLYKTEWGPIDGGPVETIPPDVLTDYAIHAWRDREELGIDRLVIHYMQPHQPYRSRPEWTGVNKNLKNLVQNRTKAGACAWQRCRKGEIEKDDLWKAYRDNLRWVLDDVTERLMPNVDGTVTLSADHGNAMGEWGEWAHPPGALGPAVRRVPWVPVECTDTQTVTPTVESIHEPVQTEKGSIDAQLEALGYK